MLQNMLIIDNFMTKGIKSLIFFYFLEIYSLYGFIVILPYFALNIIGMSDIKSVSSVHYFFTAMSMFSLVGFYLMQKFITRVRLIMLASVICVSSHALFKVVGHQDMSMLVFYSALLLISLGYGMLNISTLPAIIEQCKGDKLLVEKSIFTAYWCRNVATISTITTSYLIMKNYYYALYSIAIALIVGFCFMIFGRRYIISSDTDHDVAVIGGMISVFKAALKNDSKIDFMRKISISGGVSDTKRAKFLVFLAKNVLLFMLFESVFMQIESTYITQSSKMVQDIFGLIKFPCYQISFMNSIMVIIFLPIVKAKLIPFLNNRLNIMHDHYSKMNASFWLLGVAYIISAGIEMLISKGAVIGIAWQALPFSFITMAELFFVCIALDAVFSKTPPEMLNITALFWPLGIFGGNLLTFFLSKFFDSVNVSYFVTFSILSFVVGIFAHYKKSYFYEE